MRIVKDGKDYQGLQITNLKKLGYFFQDTQTVTYSFKESHVLELSYVRVLINCNNIKEIITVWWNDAYLSIALFGL